MKKIILVLFVFSLNSVLAADIKSILADFGVKAKINKYYSLQQKKLSDIEDKYFLQVELGYLTPLQFKKIKSHFGNFSKVPYSSKRKYYLVDFLHPAMQATVNQIFKPERNIAPQDMPADESYYLAEIAASGISSYANCWNTTFELVRLLKNKNDNQFQIYWPGRFTATSLIEDKKLSYQVRSSQLEYGDVLAIMLESGAGMRSLQHTSLIISDDLVFEKTDSSENDAYRIAYRSDVLKKYKKLLPRATVMYRRFYNETKLPLADNGFYSELNEQEKLTLKTFFPNIQVENINVGCDEKLGGACLPEYTEVFNTTVKIYKKTGRGILWGPQKLLKRFEALKIKK